MHYYAKIVLRTDIQKKDGTHPICLRLTFNRKLRLISLFKYALKENWDAKNGFVKQNGIQADEINLFLKAHIKRANDIILEYEIKDKPLTFFEFDLEFKNDKTESYYDYVEKQLANNIMTAEYSAESMRSYKSEISKLKQFKKTLNFDEITIGLIQSYEGYMRNKLSNSVNTIHKSLKTMRTFLNRAIKDDLLQENIFRKYKMKTEEAKREFLTEKEFTELELLLQQPITKKHKRILTIFLFACYTGLRFRDIKYLTYGDISEGVIRIKMHKTKRQVSIPLIEKAKALFDPEGFHATPIFRVPTNQVANRFLKEIIQNSSIKKEITFHCARHTFATHGISLGIPVLVVSQLLGHKSIKTTQIYARVVDSVKIKEMEKWNT